MNDLKAPAPQKIPSAPVAATPTPSTTTAAATTADTADALPSPETVKVPEPAKTVSPPAPNASLSTVTITPQANPAQAFHATTEPVVSDQSQTTSTPPATAPAPNPAPSTPTFSAPPVDTPVSRPATEFSTLPAVDTSAAPTINRSNRQDQRLENAQATSRSELIKRYDSHGSPVAANPPVEPTVVSVDIAPTASATTPETPPVTQPAKPPTVDAVSAAPAPPPAKALPDAPTVPITPTLAVKDLAAPSSTQPPKPIAAPVVVPLVAEAPTARPIDLTGAGQPTEPVVKIPSSPYPAMKGVESPVVDPLSAPSPTAITTNNGTVIPVAPAAAAAVPVATVPAPAPISAPPAPSPAPAPIPVAVVSNPSPAPVAAPSSAAPAPTTAVMPAMVSTQVEANNQLLTPDLMAQADPATARKEAFALAMANAPQRNVATSAIAATVAIIIMGGYIWTQNAPKMAIRTASNKAGFEASVPTFIPSQYSSPKSVEGTPGKVSLTFKAPGDAKLTITQQKSDWDAKSLLDNFVQKQSSPYLAVTGQGLTIYIYEGDIATWVNRGIWYSVQGNNQLNREQLLKIAYGL